MYKVCILAAGRGTRMESFCEYFNKVLIPIKGKPTICHIIEKYSEEIEIVIHSLNDDSKSGYALELQQESASYSFMSEDVEFIPFSKPSLAKFNWFVKACIVISTVCLLIIGANLLFSGDITTSSRDLTAKGDYSSITDELYFEDGPIHCLLPCTRRSAWFKLRTFRLEQQPVKQPNSLTIGKKSAIPLSECLENLNRIGFCVLDPNELNISEILKRDKIDYDKDKQEREDMMKLLNEKIFNDGQFQLDHTVSWSSILTNEYDPGLHEEQNTPWLPECLHPTHDTTNWLRDAIRLWVPTIGSKRHLVTASRATNELTMNADGMAVLFWTYHSHSAKFKQTWHAGFIDKVKHSDTPPVIDPGQKKPDAKHNALLMKFGSSQRI